MTSSGTARLTVDDRPGAADVLWLDNGILRIGVLPAAGGRILSVGFRGGEMLWRNSELLDDSLRPVDGHTVAPHAGTMADWRNYGGDKTWPAPQGWSGPGEWAGPPDPVLDSGAYTWATRRNDDATTVVLTSADDPRTGLRITRELTLHDGEAAYDLSLLAENTSDRPVTWALWNVTQRRAGAPGDGGVWVGLDGRDLELVELVPGTGVPSAERRGGAAFVPHQDVVGKLGFPTANGWLAHAAHGTTTSLSFAVDPGRAYPDGGSRVEVWMEYPVDAPLEHLGGLRPTSRIVEIEVLGPLETLDQGETARLRLRSGVGAGTVRVSAVAEAGHWGPLDVDGDGWSADFSSYVTGTLESARTGERIAEVEAGSRIRVTRPSGARGEPLRVRQDTGAKSWDAGAPGTETDGRGTKR